ncbi:MAG TPA: nitroreductase [Chryseosolibacter sp.]
MDSIIQIIYDRRAVRKYKSRPVEKSLIEQLVDTGRMAPSGMNLQPWKFYVVTESNLIKQMDEQIKVVVADIYKMPEMVEFLKKPNSIFHGAPVVVFITAPKVNEWAALDIGMCAQNMMLAAKASGLDTCPVGLGKFIERTSLYSQLGVPATDHVLVSLTVGYGDEQPPVHERKKDNVFYIREGVTARVGHQ